MAEKCFIYLATRDQPIVRLVEDDELHRFRADESLRVLECSQPQGEVELIPLEHVRAVVADVNGEAPSDACQIVVVYFAAGRCLKRAVDPHALDAWRRGAVCLEFRGLKGERGLVRRDSIATVKLCKPGRGRPRERDRDDRRAKPEPERGREERRPNPAASIAARYDLEGAA